MNAKIYLFVKNVEVPQNRPRSSLVESIKASLGSLNSNSDSEVECSKADDPIDYTKSTSLRLSPTVCSTDSEINFPIRSVDDAKEYLDRLKDKNAKQKAKLVAQKHEIEVMILNKDLR